MAGIQEEAPHLPLSLRFRSQQAEAGYASSRQGLLVRRAKILAWVHLLASGGGLLMLLAVQPYRALATDIAQEAFKVQALAIGYPMLLMAGFLVLARLQAFAGRPLLLEALVVLLMALSMSSMALLLPQRYVKLRGYGLAEAFGNGYGSDSGLLLSIDAFVTAAHLGLPIRWFVMAPLELLALLLYALHVLLVGSEEPTGDVFFNCALLLCLVVVAALNKRSHELDERKAFLAVINEKALRCEAEFQLSQVAGGRGTPEAEAESKSEGVTMTTDRSGPIFEGFFQRGLDQRQQLKLLAEKGDAEHWRLPASEVALLEEELGRGGFGSVRRALFSGMLVAVKTPRLEMGQMRVADLCNELRVLRHLRHPHIVAVHGCVVLPEEQQLHLVLELIEGPSLTAFVLPGHASLEPSALQRYQVMIGVCQALLYMHTRVPHVVHGDLKSDNVMVELAGAGRAVAKVLDFGLSRLLHKRVRGLGGTLAWIAPEVLSRAPVRCSADIFSLGHLLSFTSCGLLPAQNRSLSQVLSCLQSRRPPLRLRPLVQACLQPQPEQRPRIQELYRALLGLSWALQPPEAPEVKRLCCLAELVQVGPKDVLTVGRQPARLQALAEDRKEEPPQGQAETGPGPGRQQELPQPFPELPETSGAAMQALLLDCFRRWNVKGLQGRCCLRHACFQLCKELCDQCLKGHVPCGDFALPSSCEGRHCPHCGVLNVTTAACDVCGQEAPSKASL